MEEDIHKKIETYLGGDMTSEEQKQFELMMSTDVELQKAVQLSNEINHHLNNESWLPIKETENEKGKQDIENYIKSDEANELKSKLRSAGQRHKSSQKTFSNKFWIASIVAVFIIGLFTTIFLNNKSNNDLYAAYYSDNDLPSLLKRSVQNDFLNKGIKSFKAKDYEMAITLFKDYLKENNDPLLYSYLGISYLEIGNTNEALKSFDKLLNSNSLDRSRALWYKSLTYLKSNDEVKLRKILSEIINDSTNFNYKKARELLLAVD